MCAVQNTPITQHVNPQQSPASAAYAALFPLRSNRSRRSRVKKGALRAPLPHHRCDTRPLHGTSLRAASQACGHAAASVRSLLGRPLLCLARHLLARPATAGTAAASPRLSAWWRRRAGTGEVAARRRLVDARCCPRAAAHLCPCCCRAANTPWGPRLECRLAYGAEARPACRAGPLAPLRPTLNPRHAAWMRAAARWRLTPSAAAPSFAAAASRAAWSRAACEASG